MNTTLRHFLFFLLFAFAGLVHGPAKARPVPIPVVVDEEYDRYKKRGDDFFKEGRYFEARRQYQNCLDVPGFENDAYAKKRIDECNTGIELRDKVQDALDQKSGQVAIDLLHQLLALNPDDIITQGQMADFYEREGNRLFNEKRYREARTYYNEALQFASATKRETLTIQLRTIEDLLRPKYPNRMGLKIAAGVVAVGAGAAAVMLCSDYQSKIRALNRISQGADPNNTGVIDNPLQYDEYENAYKAAEAASQRRGVFVACVGVAAVATLAEAYLWLKKPKPRMSAFRWQPASQSLGLAVWYTF
ncbi:tetratricopeptide repeat protein [Larkinella sp. VNQ87]|uniref:tetratricopeptide repeat protein n=1 Tax=Larkinella sp. VNQ87 TaxID=3400921 RepID=UPI003C08507F